VFELRLPVLALPWVVNVVWLYTGVSSSLTCVHGSGGCSLASSHDLDHGTSLDTMGD